MQLLRMRMSLLVGSNGESRQKESIFAIEVTLFMVTPSTDSLIAGVASRVVEQAL